ncbi:proline-rich protein 36-like [Amyelois transitella]|uniref:proline-rich protein 36-like n=1 Tax=Amyelois transitella TaxID=680683 RepID=UPI00298FB917|nr:proline-rich protein 36-like [Amyelois transitella]
MEPQKPAEEGARSRRPSPHPAIACETAASRPDSPQDDYKTPEAETSEDHAVAFWAASKMGQRRRPRDDKLSPKAGVERDYITLHSIIQCGLLSAAAQSWMALFFRLRDAEQSGSHPDVEDVGILKQACAGRVSVGLAMPPTPAPLPSLRAPRQRQREEGPECETPTAKRPRKRSHSWTPSPPHPSHPPHPSDKITEERRAPALVPSSPPPRPREAPPRSSAGDTTPPVAPPRSGIPLPQRSRDPRLRANRSPAPVPSLAIPAWAPPRLAASASPAAPPTAPLNAPLTAPPAAPLNAPLAAPLTAPPAGPRTAPPTAPLTAPPAALRAAPPAAPSAWGQPRLVAFLPATAPPAAPPARGLTTAPSVRGRSYAAASTSAPRTAATTTAPSTTAPAPAAASSRNNGANTTAPPSQASRTKYPPIIVERLPDWMVHFRELTTKLGHPPSARPFGAGVRFSPRDDTEYRTIQRYLDDIAQRDQRISWFSYSLPAERNLKVAIRGLPLETPEDAVKEALTEKGFEVEYIKNIRARGGRPGCIFYGLLKKTSGFQEVYQVDELLLMPGIKIEAWRGKKGPAQCHRCQLFRHSSHNCHRPQACVRCGEPHAASDCPRPLEVPATCANCGGPHPANNAACPVFKREARNKRAGTVARTTPAAEPAPMVEETAPATLMAPANPPAERGATLPGGKKKRRRGAKKKPGVEGSQPAGKPEAPPRPPPTDGPERVQPTPAPLPGPNNTDTTTMLLLLGQQMQQMAEILRGMQARPQI